MECNRPAPGARGMSSDQRRPYWQIGLVIITLFGLLGCGGGGDSNDEGTVPDNPVVVDDPSTLSSDELTAAVPANVGSSLDAGLNALSGSRLSDTIVPGADGSFLDDLFNDDVRSFLDTSLGLGNSGDAQVSRDGNRITILPDVTAICAENFTGVSSEQIERERCQTLMRDLSVQLDPDSSTEGTVTYLFQDDVVATIGYGENTDSIELDLSGLKTLREAERALEPDNIDPLPENFTGVIRLDSTTTNKSPGTEAGSVSLSVKEAIDVSGSSTTEFISVAAGDIFVMSVDAGNDTGNITMDAGAVRRRVDSPEGAIDYDLGGLTAEIGLVEDSGILTVDNIGIGDSPFTIAVDNSEVVNLGLDNFGYTANEANGDYQIAGGLNLNYAYSSIMDSTLTPGEETMFGLFATSGTVVREVDDQVWRVGDGSLSYDLGDGTMITANEGDCVGETGLNLGVKFTFIVSTNAAEGTPSLVRCPNQDNDGDGISDATDNCPGVANANQTDSDNDNTGDACDFFDDNDDDNDSVNNQTDNCPAIPNGDQADIDGDGTGDACDTSDDRDTDTDGVLDTADNCPSTANSNQADQDGDGVGDACDDDTDGDNVSNGGDNCPVDSNADQADSDNDGVGDVCDNTDDSDSDNDTVLDSADNCPAVPNGNQADQDNDGTGDVCDDDRDGDNVDNDDDNCPINSNADQADSDNDGIGDVCDNTDNSDSDNDTVLDTADNCPAEPNTDQSDQDGDGMGDACDDDRDGDGVNNDSDNCPVNSNADQADSDNDGLGDICDNSNDSDTDGDGVLDTSDNCPAAPNADQADLDADNLGDACDGDRDGDTVDNENDNCPVDSNTDQTDTDNDGTGDACDSLNDNDNDGIANSADNCPSYPNPGQGDVNGNGTGDHCECQFTAQIEALGPWEQIDNTSIIPIPNTNPSGCQQNSVDGERIIIFGFINSSTPFEIFTFENSDGSTPAIGVSGSLDEQRSCAVLALCAAEVSTP